MPSVLVEAGFLSNKSDREYLGSEEGLFEFSNALALAFKDYKLQFEGTAVSK
jgi:N-acetylmuramoyl-L-alanine amidase